MKKLYALATVILLVFGAVIAGHASGKPAFTEDFDPAPYIGTWFMYSMETPDGIEYTQEYGYFCPLYVTADGRAVLGTVGDTTYFLWGNDAGFVYMADPYGMGDDLMVQLYDDDKPMVSLNTYAPDGTLTLSMVFTAEAPEGVEIPAMPAFPADAEPVIPRRQP